MSFPVRAQPFVTPMRRGRLPACSRRHTHVDGPQKTERPQRFPERDHPINHHVAGPAANPGSWTEVRLGARAHTNRTANRARASPPTRRSARHCQPRILRLTPVHCTSKEHSGSECSFHTEAGREDEWRSVRLDVIVYLEHPAIPDTARDERRPRPGRFF
jgi:hypothetical protein